MSGCARCAAFYAFRQCVAANGLEARRSCGRGGFPVCSESAGWFRLCGPRLICVRACVMMPQEFRTNNLLLRWEAAPEDSAILQAPALRVTELTLLGPRPEDDLPALGAIFDRLSCALVSCRLPAGDLRPSFLLERFGFRFIETNYRPEISRSPSGPPAAVPSVRAYAAEERDRAEAASIAAVAFQHERFHVDPRLGPALGGLRYRRWVESCGEHPTQRLTVLKAGAQLVAFFVTERREDGTEYWHLNAVQPGVQGRGYGRAAWRVMTDLAFA